MPKAQIALAACLISLGKNTQEIQLFPAGKFDAPMGSLLGEGPWQLTETGAKQLIAAVGLRQNDILIDYEHQSLTANKEGHSAPAAGWIKPDSLIWKDTGLYAQNPDWKDKAATMINADEYRYLSPVFSYDKKTGEVLNIFSVALTNTPGIDGMTAITVAAAMTAYLTPQETTMDIDELMERLRYLLNLPLTTTPEEMAGELDKLKGMIGTEAVAATSLIDLLTHKESEIAVLKSAIPNPADYVPMSAFLAVQQQQQQMDILGKEQAVAALIAAHPTVIIPALTPWATALGKQDIGALQKYIESAPPIAALTANQTQGNAPDSKGVGQYDAPDGFTADPERVAAHTAALSYQALHNCDYIAALKATGVN